MLMDQLGELVKVEPEDVFNLPSRRLLEIPKHSQSSPSHAVLD